MATNLKSRSLRWCARRHAIWPREPWPAAVATGSRFCHGPNGLGLLWRCAAGKWTSAAGGCGRGATVGEVVAREGELVWGGAAGCGEAVGVVAGGGVVRVGLVVRDVRRVMRSALGACAGTRVGSLVCGANGAKSASVSPALMVCSLCNGR